MLSAPLIMLESDAGAGNRLLRSTLEALYLIKDVTHSIFSLSSLFPSPPPHPKRTHTRTHTHTHTLRSFGYPSVQSLFLSDPTTAAAFVSRLGLVVRRWADAGSTPRCGSPFSSKIVIYGHLSRDCPALMKQYRCSILMRKSIWL